MRCELLVAAFVSSFVFSSLLNADCPKDRDQRSNKEAGLLISDFIITGTQALTSDELATIRSGLVGWCINDDRDEVEERVRNIFQSKGYFGVVVGTVGIKVNDPIARPKTVTVEADVKEGPRYRLDEINFTNNRAFPSSKLRAEFPLKKGELFERGKIGGGLEALRSLYGANGYIDFTAIPDTEFSADQTINLTITTDEGPQYRMGKLDILAKKDIADRLQAEWKLAEGTIFDFTYIDKFISDNSSLLPPGFNNTSLLPPGFTPQVVQLVRNCPKASVGVVLILDATLAMRPQPKSVECSTTHDSSILRMDKYVRITKGL
jgi:hypothetical protein